MKKSIYILLAVALLSFGCNKEGEEPAKNRTPESSSGPIDPKSLVDANSEALLLFDEIAGQAPQPGIPISVKTPNFMVKGWAVDPAAKVPAGGVIVHVEDKDFVANYGAPRPDVAANLKNPDYVKTGFNVIIDSSAIGKGKHTLIFRVVTPDRKSYYQQKQTYDVVVE